jgi:hypothetical protein
MDSWAFLGEWFVFAPYWGRGNSFQRILLIGPVADLLFRMQKCRFTTPSQDARIQVYNSFSGCRNADFRIQ